MTQHVPINDALRSLLGELASLQEQVSAGIRIIEDKLPELRRIATAKQHRRGGAGSRDAMKYDLGSVLVMVGLEQADPKALLGLIAHPILLVRWTGEVMLATGLTSFGELVAEVLADPRRLTFCRQWGRILGWRYRKPLYDARVTSFLTSGRAGPHEPWRKKDVTDDQERLIDTLVDLLDQPRPNLVTRGEAFDWIYERGGNPEYWREPELPEEWKD
jgi:hypothetical protein